MEKREIETLEDFEKFLSEDIKHFKVTIFGSARVENGAEYDEVFKLGYGLGKIGIDLITGGGGGIMRAASEGHKLGGEENKKNAVHTIGLGIRLPQEQKFNDAVEYKTMFERFSGRLDEFMLSSNAVVVAPGGLGTLLELFYTWQLVQVKHLCNIPIILMGDNYRGLLRWIAKEPLAKKYLDEADYQLVFLAKNHKQALKIIKEAHKSFKVGGKDFCINYEKYKLIK